MTAVALWPAPLCLTALLALLLAAPLLLEEEEIDTSEMERLAEDAAVQPHLEGVTPSDDWAYDDPEDYSAPV